MTEFGVDEYIPIFSKFDALGNMGSFNWHGSGGDAGAFLLIPLIVAWLLSRYLPEEDQGGLKKHYWWVCGAIGFGWFYSMPKPPNTHDVAWILVSAAVGLAFAFWGLICGSMFAAPKPKQVTPPDTEVP